MSIMIKPWVPLLVAFLGFLSFPAAAQENRSHNDTVAVPNGSAVVPKNAQDEPNASRERSAASPISSNGPADQAQAVVESILEYSYLSKTISIIQDYRALLQSFADISEERFKAAKGSQNDVFQAQLATLKLVGRQAEYEKRLNGSRSLINRLLSRSPNTEIEALSLDSPPEELSYSLEELHQLALKNPARSKRQTNRLGFSTQNASGEQGNGASNFYYALEESYTEASSAQRLMQLYQSSLIPLAGVALESALGSYQTGTTEFQQLIETALISLDAQVDYCRATADYRKAITRMETLTGLDLTVRRENADAQ